MITIPDEADINDIRRLSDLATEIGEDEFDAVASAYPALNRTEILASLLLGTAWDIFGYKAYVQLREKFIADPESIYRESGS